MRLIELLAESGLRAIEVGSFVSKRWVPQMADSDKVPNTNLPAAQSTASDLCCCKQVYELVTGSKIGALAAGSVALSALAPNMVGLEAALRAGVKEIGAPHHDSCVHPI